MRDDSDKADKARIEISAKLPMGVDTIYSPGKKIILVNLIDDGCCTYI